ncbi:MAG: acetylornithine/succinylornithine family transaminase [Firmicutes bacterium]|nr:acetylornithine/succinylornithine family transaminase [Bacillota bacterium]
MSDMNIKERDSLYIANTYNRFPIQITGGQGSLLYDENGKEYIDMGAGIATTTFGTSDPEWIGAVTEQMKKFGHTSNLYYTEPCVTLAEMLTSRTGMKKVFFSNSGAEANECAIKTARRYSELKYGDGRYKIITLDRGFHGRTLATLAATGQDIFHQSFLPVTEGFLYAKTNDLDDVKRLLDEGGVCAVMIEVICGEGGVIELSPEFIRGIDALAHERDVLFIIDEVQTGNGRTGELYGYMNFGVNPDIVTTAKGLAGGLPLGATLLSERVENVLTPGSHGSTFGGNPICCAAAINVLSRITNDLLAEVRAKGEYIKAVLTASEDVVSVTGMGLIVGVEFKAPTPKVVEKCRENGLLVLTAKEKVRLLPALNIPWALLERALIIMKDAAHDSI